MKTKKALLAAILGSGLAVSQAAMAQDGQFYLGIAFGQTDLDVSESELTAALNDGSLSSPDFDNEDSSLKLLGGYAFNENIALEAGYIDLGEYDYSATSDGSGVYAPGALTVDTELDAMFLNVKGSIPISQIFALSAKAGVFSWEIEAKAANGGGSARVDDDGNDLFFGVGASARLGGNFAIDLDFERYDLDGDDLDVLSLGFRYLFAR